MQKDNLEILLEDIRGKCDLVLEGHEVLHKEIRDAREELYVRKSNLPGKGIIPFSRFLIYIMLR